MPYTGTNIYIVTILFTMRMSWRMRTHTFIMHDRSPIYFEIANNALGLYNISTLTCRSYSLGYNLGPLRGTHACNTPQGRLSSITHTHSHQLTRVP